MEQNGLPPVEELNTYTANIYKYSGKWDTWKKCTVQCRSVDFIVNLSKSVLYSTVLGAAIECKQYSEITVESVKITLKMFAVQVVTHSLDLPVFRAVHSPPHAKMYGDGSPPTQCNMSCIFFSKHYGCDPRRSKVSKNPKDLNGRTKSLEC